MLTPYVNTNEIRILAVEKISLPWSAFAIFTSSNEIVLEKCRIIIGWLAHELLEKTFFIR